MSNETRLKSLESARSTKTTSPPERMTAREFDAVLARIDRELKDNETNRVSKLRARLTDAQYEAHEARQQARQARDDLRISRIQIDPAWQVQGFDATKLSTDQMSALLTHTAAEMTASNSPSLEKVPC